MHIPVTTPNTDAEARCLSCMMKSAHDTYAAVSSGLTAEHFTGAVHRIVFSAITAAAASVQATDLAAVWAQLQTVDGKSPVSIGDLSTIEAMESTTINRALYVEAVLASSRKRSLMLALASASVAAAADASSWSDLWSDVAPHLEKAQATTASTAERKLADICAEVRKQIQSPETRKLLATGFASWDKTAGAFRETELITIAARPGCGKTAIAVQIAHHAAKSGKAVAFFSLEMSGEELVGRVAAMRAGDDLHDKATLLREIDAIESLKGFHIFDNRDAHGVAGIEARARLLNTVPGGLSLVVVDYLQLVEPADIRAPREQQVAQMSRRFKKLAGVLKCPVMILAQLNRESEKEERRPRLSDLRESGAIEQDSDRVWFLWNDTKNMPKMEEEPSEIDVSLIQAKCRGGRPNVATLLRFNRPCFTFTQITNRK
jgi:replicative DNA helicase